MDGTMEEKRQLKGPDKVWADFAVLAALVVVVRMLLEYALPKDLVRDIMDNWPAVIGMAVLDLLLIFVGLSRIEYGTRTRMRVLWELAGIVAVSLLGTVAFRLSVSGGLPGRLFLDAWIVNALFNGVIVTLCDLFNYYRWSNRKALALEIEKRSQANYQYDLLKSQLNPHFLFNSLNVLDLLIHTDPERASHYLKKLAGIYRYLLQLETRPVVRLEEEADFVRRYVELLRERFGDAIDFSMEIPDRCLGCRIVPCGLQIPVENAVKHNVANASNVLRITVRVEQRWLVVCNNLQPKRNSAQASPGIGLANIRRQYELLFHESVRISRDNAHFEVRIPLAD